MSNVHRHPFEDPAPAAGSADPIAADGVEDPTADVPAEGAADDHVARLEKERDDYLDALQRLKAEFDNFRKRTARDRVYKEQLREILERKQINVVRAMLAHWCNCVGVPRLSP